MSAFSFGGLASGMDTATIVSQLVSLRRRPIVRLENKIDIYQQTKSAYSDFESKLSDLLKKVQELDTPQEFSSLSVTSGNEDALTASAGYLAQQGSYEVTVNTLAEAQKDRSQGYDSSTDSVGTGTFTILVDGETTNITLGAEANSLSDLRFAINESGAPVTATILHDGNETGGYYLVISAEETGTDASFSVDTSGLSGGTSPILSTTQVATNASLDIDGLSITSQTNSIAGAIEGVTLELAGTDPDEFTLNVGADPEALKEKVQEFVDAYNELFTYVDSQREEDATLRGDTSVRSVTQRIQRIMTTAMGSTGISMMYQVGVKQSEDGMLTFDSAEFTEKVAEDYSGVRDLFVTNGSNQGTIYLLGVALEEMTDATSGIFALGREALDDRVDSANDSIERYERLVVSYEARIKAQFTAMEQMISNLQSQGNALSGFTFTSTS
jgi:flagellar hook-associated protein 2